MLILSTIVDQRSFRNRVFDCHLSPDWRQMAIKNTVSSDFDPRSLIVMSVFNFHLTDLCTIGQNNHHENEPRHVISIIFTY